MDFNLNPTVSAGPFSFVGVRPPGSRSASRRTRTTLTRIDGYVSPTGFIYKNVNDIDVALEQFLAGELNLMDHPVAIPPQNYRRPAHPDAKRRNPDLRAALQRLRVAGLQPVRPEQPGQRSRCRWQHRRAAAAPDFRRRARAQGAGEGGRHGRHHSGRAVWRSRSHDLAIDFDLAGRITPT